jgi:hypothetical protein
LTFAEIAPACRHGTDAQLQSPILYIAAFNASSTLFTEANAEKTQGQSDPTCTRAETDIALAERLIQQQRAGPLRAGQAAGRL